jgi:hypothetical protein
MKPDSEIRARDLRRSEVVPGAQKEIVIMRSLQRFAPAIVLPLAMLFAGTGCAVQADDEDLDTAAETAETTGEAEEAWTVCGDFFPFGYTFPLITGFDPLRFFPFGACGF